METYKINWTTRATKDLRKVYNFYTELIGEEKAFELIMKILKRVDYLSDERFVKMEGILQADKGETKTTDDVLSKCKQLLQK